ncbi:MULTISPECIES: methyltransferase family protein [Prochlorococcus]|nr:MULTISPECIES: methyltransferase [Prochlorococcus]KGG13932.1 putative protein-S-isoprenylcysteine methyltransferase [Prochlorococcus marinus str. LG]KGG19065.1 putative protein-S-isoprenylcysteine methyltransferase [Prochlorococcus marinus str. SS2]
MSYKFLKSFGITKDGILHNKKGEWYLYAQIVVIMTQLLTPPRHQLEYLPISIKIIALLILILGAYRAILSIRYLGPNFSPLPEPRESTVFVTEGPYKYCRHPIYQSIILMSIGLTLFRASLTHLILFIILGIILVSKAKLEEKKLKLICSQYSKYLLKTPAIFKGISFFDWRH